VLGDRCLRISVPQKPYCLHARRLCRAREVCSFFGAGLNASGIGVPSPKRLHPIQCQCVLVLGCLLQGDACMYLILWETCILDMSRG